MELFIRQNTAFNDILKEYIQCSASAYRHWLLYELICDIY